MLLIELLLTFRRDVVVTGVCRMNEVNPRPSRLWVTVFGRVYRLGM